nr:uncharacterized protein LOC123771943 [Procambarus clarkii]XP_045620736.1 uncharacterized protein LOC123771943 [Procambarus clarkii]
MALVLASVLALCDGVALSPLHLLHQNDQLMNQDHNDISIQHPNHKFFRAMVDRNHELAAVETHRVELGPVTDVGREGEESNFDAGAMDVLNVKTPRVEHHRSITPTSDYKKVSFHAFSQPKRLQQKPLKRQKRFIMEKDLRSFVVPLSIFNYLGFLPVRVPGLPYHSELPSPDYSYYETTYDIKTPYRRKRRFLFF